ncbi:hypothetical protein [Xanthomonas phage vB_XooS_NR08]|nr:hypothetical protein [Xanthomonas phage vB_XooS_NR08]
MKIGIASILLIWSCYISSGNLTCGDSKPPKTVNENTKAYAAKPGTKQAKYYGSIACISADGVSETIAKPSAGELLVRDHECVQHQAEPVVLYTERGKESTQILFPRTGTQLFVPSTSIKQEAL